MEQRLVQPMDGRHPGRGHLQTTISFAVLQLLPYVTATRGAGRIMAVRDRICLVTADAAVPPFLRTLASQLLLIHIILCRRRRTMNSADFRHAKNRLPALKGWRITLRSGEPEASGGKGSFSPAIVDAGEMPIYGVRGGVTVKLVADVDEVLHRCDVDIVHGREIEDDSFEGGSVGFDGDGFAAARARIVPGAVLNCVSVNAVAKWGWREGIYADFGVGGGVGAAGLFKNGGDHVVEVMVGVRVVEAFREAVHEDAWVW